MTEEQQTQESQEETEGQAQEAAESTEAAETADEESEGQQQESEREASGEDDGEQGQEPSDSEGDGEEPQTYGQDYVSGLRNEAAGYRVRAQQAETRVQELEAARGSADEQLRNENESLRTENAGLLDRVRRSNFIETVNLPNARAAWGVLADTNLAVEYDESHRPTNLADVRRALKREFPDLFGEGSADGGATGAKKTGYSGRPGVARMAYAYENEDQQTGQTG